MKTLLRVATEMALHILACNLTCVMNNLGISAAHGGDEGVVTASQPSLKYRTPRELALLRWQSVNASAGTFSHNQDPIPTCQRGSLVRFRRMCDRCYFFWGGPPYEIAQLSRYHPRGRKMMTDSIMYHEGNRRLQDHFGSRRISDRLEEKLTRTAFTSDDKAFIESAQYLFLATADAEGRPDCSFKAGMPGFVRVTTPSELAFPDYDGNGMFKSLGNILLNADVGMLFIAMHGKPQRLRVNGRATVNYDDPLLAEIVGAQLIVRVTARAIFPNCPRYIPTMQLVEPSIYTPRAGHQPPEPAWKGFDSFKDCVHPRQPTFKG
jgi:predicted pyridoxine 5'-phosphate oxidase superfamily flavin-nucleotide-binding protein